MEQLREYLLQFVRFKDNELDQLLSLGKRETYNKGTFYLMENKICNQLSFVLSGVFKISSIQENGDEKILEFVTQRQFITDYISFITQQPARTNILVIQNARVVTFSKVSLEKLYAQSINYQEFGRLMAEMYLIHFDKKIKDNLLPAKERYERLLTENPQITQLVPQYMIASYLGISPEWLSRIRTQK